MRFRLRPLEWRDAEYIVCRVQDTTNTITWSYSAGDPSPINIFVNNLQNTTLNGNFSIATYVNVSAEVRLVSCSGSVC